MNTSQENLPVEARRRRCRYRCRCRYNDPVSAAEDSDSTAGGDRSRDVVKRTVADGFRVRVSLDRFYSGPRARMLMWAERAQPAAWLLRRLRQCVTFPPSADLGLALVVDGCLLPPSEPLAVLCPNDLVQVIINADNEMPRIDEGEVAREGDRLGEGAGEVEGDELESMKRRALNLLDEVKASITRDEEVPAECGPRRRRRARRRRAPALEDGEILDTEPPRPARLVHVAI